MKTRRILSTIGIIILIIILLLFKCNRQNEQRSVPGVADDSLAMNPALILDTEINLQQDSLPETQKPEKPVPSKASRMDKELLDRSQDALDRFIASLKPPVQVFYVSGSEVTTVTGDKGTIVKIDPSILETLEGSEISDSIRVELTEIIGHADVIHHNLRTMAGDSVLISDGMFRLELYSNKQELRIREGEFLTVEFPALTGQSMDLFYGVTTETGSTDWVLDSSINLPEYQYEVAIEPIDENDNSISSYRGNNRSWKEQYKLQRIAIRSTGWWNLDKYLYRNSRRSVLTVSYKDDTVKAVRYFLIFRDLNIILNFRLYLTPFEDVQANLPVNQNITVFAVGYRDTIPYVSEKDVYIRDSLSHELIFEKTTEWELIKKINSL